MSVENCEKGQGKVTVHELIVRLIGIVATHGQSVEVRVISSESDDGEEPQIGMRLGDVVTLSKEEALRQKATERRAPGKASPISLEEADDRLMRVFADLDVATSSGLRSAIVNLAMRIARHTQSPLPRVIGRIVAAIENDEANQ